LLGEEMPFRFIAVCSAAAFTSAIFAGRATAEGYRWLQFAPGGMEARAISLRGGACPPVPEGDLGCAGTPFGDNWTVWDADFFEPARRLLETAPWVFVRGNHEECSRGGKGWARMLDPRPFDPATGCQGPAELYFIELGDLRLAVFDVSTADEQKANAEQELALKARFRELDKSSGATWLLLHRPLWGVARIENGQPVGFNAPLSAATGGRLPANVTLMLSGHLHTFEC
jgi:Calcineurin-like phosphoesterase